MSLVDVVVRGKRARGITVQYRAPTVLHYRLELCGFLENDRIVATNLHAVFYLLRLGIPKMEKKGGTIVINGLIAAHKGFPDHAAYCASKGTLVSLVRQVAIDYGPSVRINLLCPGPVDTPLLRVLRDSAKAFPEPQLRFPRPPSAPCASDWAHRTM